VMLGSAERRKVRLIAVKLFSKYSNAVITIQSTNVTDGRTDNLQCRNRATLVTLRSRGKNRVIFGPAGGKACSSYQLTCILDKQGHPAIDNRRYVNLCDIGNNIVLSHLIPG